MKVTVRLLLIFLLFFTFACRKDPSVNLPEPKGNLLILAVDSSFTILGGKELVIPSLQVTDQLLNVETNKSNTAFTILTKNAVDTIFATIDGRLTHPEIHTIPLLNQVDDKLYGSICKSDITSLLMVGSGYNTDAIFKKIGHVKLVHAYLNQERSSKLSFLRLIVNEFNAQDDISVPVIKTYLLVGYEV